MLCVCCVAVIKTEGVARGEWGVCREGKGGGGKAGQGVPADNNRGDNCESKREAEHAIKLKRQLTVPSGDK